MNAEAKYPLPLEAICQGTSSMVESAVASLADTLGLHYVRNDSRWHLNLVQGWIRNPQSDAIIGVIHIQDIPDRRALLRLREPRPEDRDIPVRRRPTGIVSFSVWKIGDVPGAISDLQRFCDALVEELARLGFFELPEIPRDPIGIRRRHDEQSPLLREVEG